MHSGSTPDALTAKNWFLIALCSVGLGLTAWVTPSSAARLKDIRIGEYQSFTRIVFELDTAIGDPVISRTPERLELVLGGTRPDLIRKVPLAGEQGLQEIQLWPDRHALSVVMRLAGLAEKSASFQLHDPPRIVVDIHWPTVASGQTAPPASSPPPRESLESSARPALPDTQGAVESTTIGDSTARFPIRPPASQTGTDADLAGTSSTVTLQQRLQTHADPEASAAPADALPRTNRLQLYLVTALVIITIVILMLLALMLLSRHRWGQEDSILSAQEFLQDQDKRMAMLDARIQEQLKRYDEV